MNAEAASDRIRVRRGPDKGRYDVDTIHRIIDESLFAHVAFDDGEQPVCIPTLCARVDDDVMVHGSTASRMIRILATGVRACLTVTSLHGLVLARSVFEHSANYESVVAFGTFRTVSGDEELTALEAFTEKLLPGRWIEARQPNAKELKATRILAMSLDEASAKISAGPSDDDGTPDADLDIWAGVLPLTTAYGAPQPSPGLRAGIAVPPSVQNLTGR